MPKKHKRLTQRRETGLLHQVPGLDAMVRLFGPLRGFLFCLKDQHGRYLAANRAFLRRIGMEREEPLVGRTARQVFPALLAAGYEQQDASIVQSGHDMRDRLEMITNPDGSLGWYVTDKVPVRGEEGAVIAIACLSRDLRLPAAGDPRIEDLAKALHKMRRDFAQPLRIASLAEESGMSLSKFERLMRTILRVSPRQFLTHLRVEAAADRLRGSDEGIGQIAIECGFYDQASFSHQFKATTGMTATQYRRWSRDEEHTK